MEKSRHDLWLLIAFNRLQGARSTVCSILCRSKTRRATSFSSWPRTRTSPTRRTFSCVSCKIVVSSSQASLLNSVSDETIFLWNAFRSTSLMNCIPKYTSTGPYIGYGLNVSRTYFFQTCLTFRASYTTAATRYTLHAPAMQCYCKAFWKKKKKHSEYAARNVNQANNCFQQFALFLFKREILNNNCTCCLEKSIRMERILYYLRTVFLSLFLSKRETIILGLRRRRRRRTHRQRNDQWRKVIIPNKSRVAFFFFFLIIEVTHTYTRALFPPPFF